MTWAHNNQIRTVACGTSQCSTPWLRQPLGAAMLVLDMADAPCCCLQSYHSNCGSHASCHLAPHSSGRTLTGFVTTRLDVAAGQPAETSPASWHHLMRLLMPSCVMLPSGTTQRSHVPRALASRFTGGPGSWQTASQRRPQSLVAG